MVSHVKCHTWQHGVNVTGPDEHFIRSAGLENRPQQQAASGGEGIVCESISITSLDMVVALGKTSWSQRNEMVKSFKESSAGRIEKSAVEDAKGWGWVGMNINAALWNYNCSNFKIHRKRKPKAY